MCITKVIYHHSIFISFHQTIKRNVAISMHIVTTFIEKRIIHTFQIRVKETEQIICTFGSNSQIFCILVLVMI